METQKVSQTSEARTVEVPRAKLVSALPAEGLRTRKVTLFENALVQHAYPPKLILDTLAVMWSGYYLWQGEFAFAMVALGALAALGTYTTLGINKAALMDTAFGQYCLMAKNPVTFVAVVAGYVGALYGLWVHSTFYLLGGISLIGVGRLIGWKAMFKARGIDLDENA